MSQQNQCALCRLQLPLLESETLYNALDQAICSADPASHATIEKSLDKLEDAQTAALWLRENVTLELDPNELQISLQAVDRSLTRADPNDENGARMERLRKRLALALNGDHAVLPGIESPLHVTCLTV